MDPVPQGGAHRFGKGEESGHIAVMYRDDRTARRIRWVIRIDQTRTLMKQVIWTFDCFRYLICARSCCVGFIQERFLSE
jgi:hypothetical protein